MAGKAHSSESRAKAQGSTEYLVVFSVVLVIALVVIGLLSFYPSTGGSTKATQTQIYWQSSRPIAVTGAAQRNTTPCGGTASGSYVMELKNTGSNCVDLTGVRIGGNAATICTLDGNVTDLVAFDPGETRAVSIAILNRSCAQGQTISSTLEFIYNSNGQSGMVEYGTKEFSVICREPMSSSGGGGTPVPPTCSSNGESCAALSCCDGAGLICSGCMGGGPTCDGGVCRTCGNAYGDPCDVVPCCAGFQCLEGANFCIPASCFLPGTLVNAPGGEKPIESIKEGDMVYSFAKDGSISASRVLAAYSVRRDSYYRITAEGYEVNATAEHPFLTPEGYRKAESLAAGDTVFVYKDGALSALELASVSHVFEPATVYNLQVDGSHTFIANGFAVHNKPMG